MTPNLSQHVPKRIPLGRAKEGQRTNVFVLPRPAPTYPRLAPAYPRPAPTYPRRPGSQNASKTASKSLQHQPEHPFLWLFDHFLAACSCFFGNLLVDSSYRLQPFEATCDGISKFRSAAWGVSQEILRSWSSVFGNFGDLEGAWGGL